MSASPNVLIVSASVLSKSEPFDLSSDIISIQRSERPSLRDNKAYYVCPQIIMAGGPLEYLWHITEDKTVAGILMLKLGNRYGIPTLPERLRDSKLPDYSYLPIEDFGLQEIKRGFLLPLPPRIQNVAG